MDSNRGSMFHIVDYVVLVIMLLISALIGVYYRFTGGRQKTTKEYLLGDRDLSILPVGISLMASFMSAITLLGVSSESYFFGTQFVAINLGYGLVTPIAAYGFLPVFFKLQAVSAYEYLELRFGTTTRLLTSIAFSLQMILYMGIVLYAPALALEALTGISRVVAILSVGIVCTFYATIGGIKAVVVTDVFQSLLMFAAVFVVIIVAAVNVGGLQEIWKIAGDGGRLEFDNISPDPTVRHTWWSLVLGGGFTYCSLYAVNQTQVQRLLTLRDLRRSQIALWLSWPVLSLLSVSTLFSGLSMYSRYYNCDPMKTGRIVSTDQLMPLFIGDTTSGLPGVAGLFVAGIFSGSLSTVSSAVNSLAAVTLEDYLKPVYNKMYHSTISESRSTIITKILALLYGILCLAIAFLAQSLGGVLQASLTIFGVIGGPVLGVFTLGMFIVYCNQFGANLGLLCGLGISFWLGFGGPKPPPKFLPLNTDGCSNYTNMSNWTSSVETDILYSNITASKIVSDKGGDDDEYFYLYRLSYMWYIIIGFCITIISGIIFSLLYKLLTKQEQTNLHPDLFSPFIRSYVERKFNVSNSNHLSNINGYMGSRKIDKYSDCKVSKALDNNDNNFTRL